MSRPELSQRQLDYHETHRMNFSSKLEFFLATLGFSAGFGSVWRFPYCFLKKLNILKWFSKMEEERL
jgi:hypothetical protein